MSSAIIIGIGVVLLIVVIAVRQRSHPRFKNSELRHQEVPRGRAMIKSIEKDHICIRRDGNPLPVRLAAYKKNGRYVVSKGPNLVSAEVACATLEDVLQYASKGYMIRMQSEIMEIDGKRRRINGLYSADDIEVVR